MSVTFRPADLLPAGVTAGPLTRIERCPASAILPRIVVDATSVRLRLQSGALVAWPLSAADEAALRAGLDARATPDKFLAAAAQRIGPLDAFERIPTTILCGTKDLLTSVGHSRKMAKRIPGARLVEATGAGHMVILERFEKVNAVLQELLDQAEGRDAA